jgi:hypothetical protein
MTAVAVALLLAAPAALAQITPEASILPITEPTDVGGTVLQPGTYTIRVINSFSDRNKIQVVNQAGQTVATALTVPHELEPNEEVPNTTFVYYPAGEGMPRALRTWFASDPPGRHGHDIVYEEDRAKQLARLARARVVTFENEVAETDLGTTTLREATPEATIETYVYTPPVVTETRTTVREVETPAPMVSNTTEVEMPATASKVPAMALLGLLAIGAAIAIRVFRG